MMIRSDSQGVGENRAMTRNGDFILPDDEIPSAS
jgi:hypothetical protein